MKIKEIVSALERFAPLPLQDGYDNAGLQIGVTETEATGALLCLDVTEAVIDEAIASGFNLIISHHPLIFRGYKSITGRDYVERCMIKAIKHDITIYSAHTNLDNAHGGVSFVMAKKLGMKEVRVLAPQENGDGTSGSGVIGDLETPLSSLEFLQLVKNVFHADCVRYNGYQGTISKVALCGGAGAFLMTNAMAQHADAFLTGEIRYHEYFGHEDEILLTEIGHFESEQYTLELLESIIKDACNALPTKQTHIRTNPINYL